MSEPGGQPERAALLANVGNRDLLKAGRELRPARSAGEEVLARFESEKNELELPILGPALRYLGRTGASLARIVLFATDQPESVEPRHRQSDTVHFAEIIRRLLQQDQRYRDRVVVRTLRTENPSLYDETYRFYQRELAAQKLIQGIDRFYVLGSGGTPAMNLGLLVAAIERLGERCDPLYLREGAHEPDPLNLGQQLREATLRQLARSHLERDQFAAAAEVLGQLPNRSTEKALAAYAAARLNFDWRGAWAIANRLVAETGGEERRLASQLRDEARILEDGADPALLLGELYHKARVACRSGAYKEFLVFLFALDEYALKEIIRQNLGIDFSRDEYVDRQARLRQVAEQPELKAFLESRTAGDGQKLRYEVANRLAMRAYLDFLAMTAGPEAAALAEVRRIVDRLNGPGLARKRNEVVHGVGGASAELIETAYNPTDAERRDLLADLLALTRAAGGRTDNWTLDRLRQHLLDGLSR